MTLDSLLAVCYREMANGCTVAIALTPKLNTGELARAGWEGVYRLRPGRQAKLAGANLIRIMPA